MSTKAHTILVSLTLLAASPPLAADPSPRESRWLTRVDEAIERAAAQDRYVLVDLYADWCGWCKVLEEKVFSDPAFLAWARDFVLLRVDVEDGGEGSELQARYGASSLPTTLLLDRHRVKVGAVTGFHPTGRFIAALEAEIDAFRDLVELFDRVRASGDVELQERLAADFHQRGDGRRAAALYEEVLERVRGEGAAWLHFRAAAARLLGGEPGAAERHLERSRSLAQKLGDGSLVELLDLLSYRIADRRGDCRAVVASLEHFLAEHPRSRHSREARRTLREIQESGDTKCI